jgi:c-di-GMP-binding flagellar brake protein YcgR
MPPVSTDSTGPVVTIDPGQVESFDARRLDVRPGTRVLLQPPWPADKLWAEFVGMKRGRFILLLLPQPTALQVRDILKEDEPVTVRFVQEGCRICGFKTRVAQVLGSPAPMLVLRFPDTCEAFNMRRHDRASSLLPATLFHDGRELRGTIADLSRGGCRVVLRGSGSGGETFVPQGAEVLCSFSLPGGDQAVAAKGLVRNAGQNGGKTVLGVQFWELSAQDSRAVEDFVLMIKDCLEASEVMRP